MESRHGVQALACGVDKSGADRLKPELHAPNSMLSKDVFDFIYNAAVVMPVIFEFGKLFKQSSLFT